MKKSSTKTESQKIAAQNKKAIAKMKKGREENAALAEEVKKGNLTAGEALKKKAGKTETEKMNEKNAKANQKKEEKKTPAKRTKKEEISLEERIAALADSEAMSCQHVALDARLLKKAGIDPKEITGALIHRAHLIQREKINASFARAEALNRKNAPKLPEEIIPPPSQNAPERAQNEQGEKKGKESSSSQKARQTKPQRSESGKEEKGGETRVKIFDYAPTAILRWMGKTGGWEPEEALKVLTKMGASLSIATCKIQIKAGSRGERGEPAGLSKKQMAELKSHR